MPQGKPQSGEKYRHFKDKLYQIVAVAKHSETGEALVIYQALYGDFSVYARPLSMFISQVDHEKYPKAVQKYRFELVEPEKLEKTEEPEKWKEPEETAGKVKPKEYSEVLESTEPSGVAAAKKEITDLLMDFYDAKTYEEKYDILTEMRGEITDIMINNMAVVLDLVIPEGDLDRRYEELKNCLRTCRKYENSRF